MHLHICFQFRTRQAFVVLLQPPQLPSALLLNPEPPRKLYINRIQLTVALSVEASWAFFVSILFGMFVLVILVWFQFGESC